MTDIATPVREFKMPDVGEGLTEAEILKWYVAPGDTVTDGQVVCEVETAKAAVELPIPFDGVVRELRFPEGTTVDVGQVIITIGGAGDEPEPAAVPQQTEQPAEREAAQESGQEAKPAARQPVLVGYGVSEASTKRRARKSAAPEPEAAPEGTYYAPPAATPSAAAPSAAAPQP
ncbi:2-oxo acid dehydrogenase subunit E2, partial [Streptomyces sp. SID10853]|uniref:biotin/lipoyl-containing protein n=1 Tax=Streptomyces sp. SID10853 TaxID=2706028 RepID=UPI0013C121A7|nr:2-oxo acid dehydrogenase subunit E2 [Streptomyces sp. SID10853]